MCVTDCHGRISAATNVMDYCRADIRRILFSRNGLSHPVKQTAQNRGIFPHCTVAILRKNDTVNRENDTDIRGQIAISKKGYDVRADKMNIFVCTTLWRPKFSTRARRCTCKRRVPREK